MYHTSSKSAAGNRLIDLRSDTVTRPSAGMRKAMANAEVGDDVFGDDPTVQALEEFTADLLGKEAGLLVTSGTQSNLTALLTHCGRGDEYIGGAEYHISKYEAGGAAVLGGISPRHLPLNDKGGLDASAVEAAIQEDDPHFAATRLVCLENTHNGRVVDQDGIERTAAVARTNSLGLHIDGARLMNAAVRSGRPAAELVACADTVSLCLSKGLGAPVGSVLCGPADFIKRARRARKILGGGLRQSGIIAACGLYALNNNIERLAEDHEAALAMATRLAQLPGTTFDLATVQTNMIWMTIDEGRGQGSLAQYMAERGVLLLDPFGHRRKVRLVTHLDFEPSRIDAVVDGFAGWLGAETAA